VRLASGPAIPLGPERENLIRETPSSAAHRLPPVVVCVVHNGPRPWDALLDIAT